MKRLRLGSFFMYCLDHTDPQLVGSSLSDSKAYTCDDWARLCPMTGHAGMVVGLGGCPESCWRGVLGLTATRASWLPSPGLVWVGAGAVPLAQVVAGGVRHTLCTVWCVVHTLWLLPQLSDLMTHLPIQSVRSRGFPRWLSHLGTPG